MPALLICKLRQSEASGLVARLVGDTGSASKLSLFCLSPELPEVVSILVPSSFLSACGCYLVGVREAESAYWGPAHTQ